MSRLREKGLKERGKGSWKSLKITRINSTDLELIRIRMEVSDRMQLPREWEVPFLVEAITLRESKPSSQVSKTSW
jgi:hypothetical protein